MAKQNLNIKVFEDYDRDWLDIILLYRRHLDADNHKIDDIGDVLEEYDVIAGPMADNGLLMKLNDFEDNPYERDLLLDEIKMERTNYQIAFRTPKSLKALRMLHENNTIEF